jgi:hypothetical protein
MDVEYASAFEKMINEGITPAQVLATGNFPLLTSAGAFRKVLEARRPKTIGAQSTEERYSTS